MYSAHVIFKIMDKSTKENKDKSKKKMKKGWNRAYMDLYACGKLWVDGSNLHSIKWHYLFFYSINPFSQILYFYLLFSCINPESFSLILFSELLSTLIILWSKSAWGKFALYWSLNREQHFKIHQEHFKCRKYCVYLRVLSLYFTKCLVL